MGVMTVVMEHNAWVRCYGGGAGQIRCQYNNGGLYMSINATAWTAASDERLKNCSWHLSYSIIMY